MRSILDTLDATLEQVIIHDIHDSTFLQARRTEQRHYKRSTRARATASRSRFAPRRRSTSATNSVEEATAEKKPVDEADMEKFNASKRAQTQHFNR